ncbi:MAG: hypothetical protein AB1457_18215, partial [Chloroflexota bacterium]
MEYPKGSEWRRWDLQVQTILDDNYTSLKDYSEAIKANDADRWQQYVARVGGEPNAILFDSKTHFNDVAKDKKARCTDYARNLFAFVEVFNPELACIGFTDHNYFDDCLLDVLIDCSKRSRCKAIAGVEINCNGVHLLVFFGEKPYGKDTYSAGIQAFLAKLDIDAPKKNGILTTTTCNIKDLIARVQDNDGILIYPHCNGPKGLFQLADKTILAETFNSQKLNLLQFQNREGFDGLEKYIKSNLNLKSKYSMHISSDSRALKDVGRVDKDGNALWIKANPSFNGLRQIIYEADQRVFVGAARPDQKKPYFLIDRVRFLDNTNPVKFGSDPIEINQNLTAIIGGKSTGKSLLLYYMAKTIDKAEVEGRIASTGLEIGYELDASPDFNFEVIWKDGQSTFLKANPAAGPADSKERKILFVPQKYLNTLSEKKIESRDALNKFILNVILQDAEIKTKYEQTLGQIGLLFQSLPTKIAELFSEAEDIKRTEEELKQAGDEKGIETYVQTLQAEIDVMKAESGLTEDELKQYEAFTTREAEINTSLSNLEGDKKTIRSLHAQLISKVDGAKEIAEEHQGYLNDADVKKRLEAELKILDTFAPSITTATSRVLASIEAGEAKLKGELAEIRAKSAPFVGKVQAQSNLNEKSQAIIKEQEKLAQIAVKKNAVKTKDASFKKRAESLLAIYTQVAGKYEGLKNEFKNFESKFEDIALAVHVAFKEEAFNSDVVEECLNKRDMKKSVAEQDWGEDSKYKYDPQRHLANIAVIFKGLLSGSVKTVKGRSSKDALSK